MSRRNFRFISTIGYATCVYGTWEIYLTYVISPSAELLATNEIQG